MILAGALLATGAALAMVAARGPSPPRTLQDRVRAVAATLRCPVCQDLSVADSPSVVAQQMRRSIAQDLRAGWSEDRIRSRFVASYGQWILLSPPKRGVNLVAWIAPVFVLLFGAGAASWAALAWSRGGAFGPAGERAGASTGVEPSLSADDRALLHRALEQGREEPE